MGPRAEDGGSSAVTADSYDGGSIQCVDVTSALPGSVREGDVDGGAKVIPKLQDHLIVVLVGGQRVIG